MRKFYTFFGAASCYILCCYILQIILVKTGIFATLPDSAHLLAWDANWYRDIADNGVLYWGGTACNAGFFPLFPALWKITGLDALGISAVNSIIFASGFGIFGLLYLPNRKRALLLLTIPSTYFAWVPYTEALFIMLTCCTFWGMIHERKRIVFFCLFLLALTRPTTLILLPALLLMELLTTSNEHLKTSFKKYCYLYALPLLLGLGIFIWYQYRETGVWLAYFKAQTSGWGHTFALPVLPFSNVAGLPQLLLDAAALFAGLVSALWVMKLLWNRVTKNKVYPDKIFALSLLYLAGSSAIIILASPVWTTYTTNVAGAHRYTFATAYFWVFLHYVLNKNAGDSKWTTGLLISTNVFWLCFGHYASAKLFLHFNLVTLVLILYLLANHPRLGKPAFIGICLTNFGLQVYLFQQFISNVFPD